MSWCLPTSLSSQLTLPVFRRYPHHPYPAPDGFACTPINFEKDDSANKHMDFIYAAANLRARQYNIPESDMMAARKFVGDIIPAIATTTAICTGLVALELIKLVGNRPKEAFYNNNFNLAVNTFNKFEVDECKAIEIGCVSMRGLGAATTSVRSHPCLSRSPVVPASTNSRCGTSCRCPTTLQSARL